MKEIIYVYTTETYKSKNWYKIGMTNKVGYTTSSQRDINPHLEAINYLQWEFMLDRKDPRIDNGVNQKDIDIDFSKYSVEEFLKEIMKLKN